MNEKSKAIQMNVAAAALNHDKYLLLLVVIEKLNKTNTMWVFK